MGEMAKALGITRPFEHAGQEYILPETTFEVHALLELWFEGRAWEALERTNGHLDEAGKEAARSRLLQDIAAGKYGVGTPGFVAAMQTPVGQKELIYLLLKKGNPDKSITRRLLDEMYEQGSIVRYLQSLANDPNPQAPVKAGAE
jgi:hypothetical protein